MSEAKKPTTTERKAVDPASALLGGDARFAELMTRLKQTGIGKAVSASEWSEVEEFIEENIRPEGMVNQEEYNKGWDAGCACGVQRASTTLLKLAADLFTSGKDEEARRMRDLAKLVAA